MKMGKKIGIFSIIGMVFIVNAFLNILKFHQLIFLAIGIAIIFGIIISLLIKILNAISK